MKYHQKKCVVIPCFNVANDVFKVISKIDLKIIEKVFVIDDCCPQKTGKFLKKKLKNKLLGKKIDITILKKNLGVGGATIVGFKKALKLGYDIVFKLDGDGQHNPRDIKKFLKPLLKSNINFCKGSRFLKVSERNKIPKLRYCGNIVLTFLTKFNCKKIDLTDAVNGFIAIKSSLLKKINLKKISSDFFFEEDLLFHISFHETKIGEVPIKTLYHEKSNLNPVKTIIPFIIKHAKNLIIRYMHDIFKKKIY
tara:strand:+ start:393 stop:1145 length:753 start_codon:yes stop_codon:yes gene_type:complete